MHDLKFIRDNPEAFDAALARRGLPPQSRALLELDEGRRRLQTEVQQLLARRNEASRQIGQVKSRGGDASALMEEVAGLKTRVPALEQEEQDQAARLDDLIAALPNLPAAETPDGLDESANVELRRVGAPREFRFEPKDHVAIGEGLGLMDFSAAARMSGARFVALKGSLARLERAIAAFMLDTHTQEFGYLEVAPPMLVRTDTMFGTGQLPKFAEDQFRTTNDYWLIPTAEVPLTNLVREEILEASALPLRFTAWTPCFRAEAGAAGRDTRGIIRQHQFSKVELVSVCAPEQSEAEHERMTACAEAILQRLDLPYRVMALAAGDMGFSARKTYDIEVWLPGQSAYREISSCSNCGDFQARRMKARYRVEGEKGTRYVHTLNGSGLAVGRTMVAVLENYQDAAGGVTVPEALRPYLGGLDRIPPPA